MAHDGRILARARDILSDRKRKNEDEQRRRRAEVYARLPQVRTLDGELSAMMAELISGSLRRGEDAVGAVRDIQDHCNEILARRGQLLNDGGFPEDYTDERYCCKACRDTGYIMGQPCSCLEELYHKEAILELSSVLDIKNQCFENFDLSYYDGVCVDGIPARNIMSTIFETCRQFATNFGPGSMNLLFRGGTGLGKTFLSACIAGLVSAKGCSVIYDTAVSILSAFEDQKFDRGDLGDAAGSRVNRFLGCELLIIDDLGTELTTGFTQSALYTLINTRLVNGKKTIISTNLGEADMLRRYTPQINSRLEGEYITLRFAGTDIRAIKRERALQ